MAPKSDFPLFYITTDIHDPNMNSIKTALPHSQGRSVSHTSNVNWSVMSRANNMIAEQCRFDCASDAPTHYATNGSDFSLSMHVNAAKGST